MSAWVGLSCLGTAHWLEKTLVSRLVCYSDPKRWQAITKSRLRLKPIEGNGTVSYTRSISLLLPPKGRKRMARSTIAGLAAVALGMAVISPNADAWGSRGGS